MFWNDDGQLNYRVHLKPNQQLKYLNQGSSHTFACFEAIYKGVSGRLAKLTSRNNDTENVKLNDLYPEHAKALEHANLAPEAYPSLGEILDEKGENTTNTNNEEKKKNKFSRQVFFCVGYHKSFEKPIHTFIRQARNKYKLKWLRTSMSYHKFPNVTETFQGDLSKKIMNGVASKDFMDRKCNCEDKIKIDGNCVFNGDCRKCCVIYDLECKLCPGAHYIGCTQDQVKKRTGQHCNDVKRLVEKGDKSTSFASHFAQHFKQGEKISAPQVRELLKVKILWQGKIISCMKTFGQNSCSLCMSERCLIWEHYKKDRTKLINSKSELFGACRHKTKFHRLTRNKSTSTDDGAKPEKVSASTTATTIANQLSKAAGRLCHAAGTVVGF